MKSLLFILPTISPNLTPLSFPFPRDFQEFRQSFHPSGPHTRLTTDQLFRHRCLRKRPSPCLLTLPGNKMSWRHTSFWQPVVWQTSDVIVSSPPHKKTFVHDHRPSQHLSLILRKIAKWMSKNCQKLDIFSKKLAKIVIFQQNCQWQFCWKNDNFCQFLKKKKSSFGNF